MTMVDWLFLGFGEKLIDLGFLDFCGDVVQLQLIEADADNTRIFATPIKDVGADPKAKRMIF